MADLLGLALDLAERAQPGEEVEAYVSRVRETDVKVFDRKVESLMVAERSGVGVRVIIEGRQGFAWAGSLDLDVVETALADARDNAEFATPDDCQGVVTPEEARGDAPALDLWSEDLGQVATEAKVALALEVEAATLAADPRLRGVEQAIYGDALAESAVANSRGVSAAVQRTTCSCAVIALAGVNEATQTGYGFSAGRSFTDLDPEVAARDAALRSTRLLGATQPASRRLPVVLDPLVTRSVLAVLGGALSGEAILKGRSVLVGREGEQVGAAGLTLCDDPTDAEAFGASAHDAEGVASRRNELIVDGVLRGFLHNAYTGRRSGTGTNGAAIRGFASTPGCGARALALTPGTRSAEQVMAAAGDALYVQSVSGLHSGTNPVSGDFSVGAEGLMLRGGAFAEPVREVTIASTLPRILLDVVEIGSDVTWLPGGAAGVTLLIGEMSMSGASPPVLASHNPE
ncbi:MAG: TldD/PmbA family protein [Acidimicrobiia bacterium]